MVCRDPRSLVFPQYARVRPHTGDRCVISNTERQWELDAMSLVRIMLRRYLERQMDCRCSTCFPKYHRIIFKGCLCRPYMKGPCARRKVHPAYPYPTPRLLRFYACRHYEADWRCRCRASVRPLLLYMFRATKADLDFMPQFTCVF